MGGCIYFCNDKNNGVGESRIDPYVSSGYFDCFGDLLTDALSEKYSELLEIIKEGEVAKNYSFGWLSAKDYNLVIKEIRIYIASLTEPTEIQKRGIWVWQEMAEPFFDRDERYDAAFQLV